HTPGGLDTIASPVQRADYANQAFESYYSNLSAPDFTQVVWVNNAFIAAQMVAFGVTGLYPIYAIVQNAVAIGGAGAMMAEADELGLFFFPILPRGQRGVTATVIAGGGGLTLLGAWLLAGALRRGQALAAGGRALSWVALGVGVVLGVAGVVGGFVPRT